jgi:dihydroflavonol-4-reductase
MRVLVTGATGLLGNNLVRLLTQSGHEVVCLVRPTYDRRTLVGIDCRIAAGPWDNDAFLSKALNSVDAVIHAAAKLHIGWREIESSIATNVGLTARLAGFAARGEMRMIHVSTVDALAPAGPFEPKTEAELEPAKPPSAYVVSKRLAEAEFLGCVARGLDGLIVNPGFMVGPWDWKPSSGQMMLSIARRYVPLAPAGGCSVLDVRDACRGIINALTSGRSGERYILGGENVTYLELWREIAGLVGSRPPLARLFAPISWLAGGAGDLWTALAGREPLLNSAMVRMGQMHHYYSSGKAQRELNYQISPYQTALGDAWHWFLEHGYAAPPRRRSS